MRLLLVLSVFLFSVSTACSQTMDGGSLRHPLTGLYEPSGLATLPDGRILVVEDELPAPISLLHPETDKMDFFPLPLSLGSGINRIFGLSNVFRLDDLEAATLDTAEYVYVITSHSRTKHGNRFRRRERLARFRLDGDGIADFSVIEGLREQITALSSDLEKASQRHRGRHGLNIEGMAFDPAHDRLLIGLRQPVIDGQAVVLPMPQPGQAFSDHPPDAMLGAPVYLDLGGGGIRAMEFYPRLDGFLIVSRKEKRGAAFKLWFWKPCDGQPRQVNLPPEIDLKNAEGVAVVGRNGSERIMLIFDDGNRMHNRVAEYTMLTPEQILAGLTRQAMRDRFPRE